jgi:hypothetical protein
MPEIKTVIVQTGYAHADRGDPRAVARSSRASRAVSRPLRSGRSSSLPRARLAKNDPSRGKLGLSCAEQRALVVGTLR